MTRIAIIVGSTRPGRNGTAVAEWVHQHAKTRTGVEYELLDLEEFKLPLLDEPVPASMGMYSKDHTKTFAGAIAGFDGYVFVTPEYNHATSGALKNALDYVYAEWNNKAAGFVSYGSAGGVRAVENLRLIASELQLAHVRAQVAFSLATDFENYSVFTPAAHHEANLTTMLDQLESWTVALQGVRAADEAVAA